MHWWNQTRLAGLRGQLIARLRRWYLPYAAVFQADLASLARSWVLRAWFILTVLVALVATLDRGAPEGTSPRPGSAMIAALFQSGDTASGTPETIRDLLKIYIVIWVSLIIVLTGGTISSELGVVADAVLSRGISRWQYFLGKWTARLTAVLSVYAFVMIPTASLVWLGTPQPDASDNMRSPIELTSSETGGPPGSLPLHPNVSMGGLAFALGHAAVVLAFVVTCSVAFSASFDSTVISIAVGWVSIYGTGLVLSILDISRFSPGRLIRDLPDVVAGRYVATDQYWQLGGWAAATLFIALLTGARFSARDI